MAISASVAEAVQKTFGAGNNHNCQIKDGGSVWCWGDNSQGQIGQGNTSTPTYSTAVQVLNMSTGVTEIAVGNSHTCALKADRSVWCWGYNRSLGIVGKGEPGANVEATPVQVKNNSGSFLTNVVEIDADFENTCARTLAGEVWCWGHNYAGQLGTGSSDQVGDADLGKAVRTVSSGARAISVGNSSSCMITTSGGVKCWGDNSQGQIGNASATTQNNPPTDVTGLSSGVLAVTVGQDTACALLPDNVVKCWGNNLFGAVGDGTTTNAVTPQTALNMPAGIVSIGGAYGEIMVLTSAGRLYKWGNPSGVQEWSPITGAKYIGFTASRTSWSASCYMIENRTVYCQNTNTNIAAPNPGAPSAPTNTVQVGDTQATISVSPGTGGGPVSTYTVTAVPGPLTCTVTPPATSCTITGLTNGTAYTFTSKANNPFGSSADSEGVTKTPTTAPGTPGAPTVVVGDREATVTVVPPSDGGSPSSYVVTAEPNGGTCTVTPPATSCTITGLANGTSYEFSTVAKNDVGDSSPSPKSAPLVPNPIPDAPGAPTVTVTDGQAIVTVTPNGSGGTPDFYTVTAEPGGASCTVTPPATSCTMTGLTNGTSYEFSVSATNDAGTSPQSEKSAPQIPDTAPLAPGAPTVVVGDGKATITVIRTDGGGTPRSYVVTAEPGGATCTVVVPATSCTITGLTNETPYEFYMVAINDAGTSPSSPKSRPLVPNLIPNAPAAPTVTVADGEATITVAQNESGAKPDFYTITAEPSGKTCKVTSPATSCNITGLTNGTAYTFTTTATNDAGTSAASKPSAQVVPDAKPSTPKTPNVMVGDGQATITVARGDGGGKPLSFTVVAEPGGARCTVTSPATSCNITGLTNGTAYTFTTTATNDAGTSGASAPSNAHTPNPAPTAAPTFTVKAGKGQATIVITGGTSMGVATSFVVTAKPGGSTCTVTLPTNSCTVMGLKNGTSYTFTVVAVNGAGTSAASAPSAPVVPGTSATPASFGPGAALSTSSIPITGSNNEMWPWAALLGGFGALVLFSRRRWSTA